MLISGVRDGVLTVSCWLRCGRRLADTMASTKRCTSLVTVMLCAMVYLIATGNDFKPKQRFYANTPHQYSNVPLPSSTVVPTAPDLPPPSPTYLPPLSSTSSPLEPGEVIYFTVGSEGSKLLAQPTSLLPTFPAPLSTYVRLEW